MGFSTDEPKPPLTAPIGLETRNWLWKRVDLAKKSLALNTNCEEHDRIKRIQREKTATDKNTRAIGRNR